MLLNEEIKNEDCVICLFSLLEKDENTILSLESSFIIELNKCGKLKLIIGRIMKIILDFHSYNFDLKKEYMMTPCKHYFHASCLESWFKQKKECPSCRKIINEIIY